MKLSENGLYVERYIKCVTCGVLIYNQRDQELLTHDGNHYCSQWCIDWKKAREARRPNLSKFWDGVESGTGVPPVPL